MSEWKEYNITEVCDTISDTYRDGAEKVVLINTSDVLEGVVTNHEFVPNKNLAGQFKKTFQKDDILYSEIRPANKRYAYVDFEAQNYIASTKLMVLRSKPCILPKYLYYLLTNNTTIRNLHTIAVGRSGTFPQITYSELANIKFKLPSVDEQKEILSTLLDYDDKIAVNKRICENLEAQAQALFKHWFVDFAPFKDGKFVESELGLIPEGWRVCTLGEICKCELGGTPSRANKSYWGGNIAWINSGEVNKFRICEASEFITEDGLNHSATKLLPAKTTVLAITGATLGQVSLLEIDSCANQSVVGVKENETIPYTFIYPAIKCNIGKLVNMQTGGAQQHINKDNIQSLQFIEPPKNIMEEYKLTTLPIYEEIGKLCFENLRLATLRDTLLPKLMSGEIPLE